MTTPAGNASPRERTRQQFEPVLRAITVHGDALARLPGVVAVRPGYRFAAGRITAEPVITVAVLRKRPANEVAAAALVPPTVDGVPTDVVPASPAEQLVYQQPTSDALADAARGMVELRLPGDIETAQLDAVEDSALLPYRQPPGQPKNPPAIEEEMTVLCHVSPDAGWKNLKQFLAGTRRRLTSTMYEFTEPYIVDALRDGVKNVDDGQLRLILDPGPNRNGDTLKKDEIRKRLAKALGKRFTFRWAAVPEDGRTTGGFFPNAYHIKVTVRDGDAFWLSSGNWKRSNQPDIDPIGGDLPDGLTPRKVQTAFNREWHVIIENRTLAEFFEKYIRHDMDEALPLQVTADVAPRTLARPDLFITLPEADVAAAGPPPEFFDGKRFVFENGEKLRVQPLLTPDNYADHVLPLLRNAKRRIWFQNQSLKVRNADPRFVTLIDTLRDRMLEDDLDVRIIIRGDFDVDAVLTDLAGRGFDMDRVKLQRACHNKGIVIDDDIVVVGSHNWTRDGTFRNRDASLIFRDKAIAAYFERLLDYDWERLARHENPHHADMPVIARPNESTPPGMRRVTWEDYYGDD
jgi:hypothetical protein